MADPGFTDDTAIKHEPLRHVDYLSHDWREEDMWASWRHAVSHRKLYGQKSRLENALWRAWGKSKYQLHTIRPETLNWFVPHRILLHMESDSHVFLAGSRNLTLHGFTVL